MATRHISVEGGSNEGYVMPVRRRRKGDTVDTISISIPKQLNQTINGIAVKDNKSRSLVISELLEKGLKEEK